MKGMNPKVQLKNVQNHDDQDPFMDQMTPECFNDWRLGGSTQRHGDNSQSQFVFSPEHENEYEYDEM